MGKEFGGKDATLAPSALASHAAAAAAERTPPVRRAPKEVFPDDSESSKGKAMVAGDRGKCRGRRISKAVAHRDT